jgi:hypothetical protein
MDWDETFVDDGGQDDKKMGADVKTGARKASGRASRSPRERSITTAHGSSGTRRGSRHQSWDNWLLCIRTQRCEFGGPK